MRIQETNRILKESQTARHHRHEEQHRGLVTRAWKAVSSLPHKRTTKSRRG